NNTIVRFDVFTGGTNFGNIDIELFDEDKPESVKNFLLYVYSGGYSNLLIHRVDTNVAAQAVLQAGHVRLQKPHSSNTFDGYFQNRSLGRITNEFSVGPLLSNTFGTIAAARVSSATNSATTDWYINLADNVSLDSFQGGFTVFGRVINTTSPNNGTNLLNYFATITNLTFAFFSSEAFQQLPFSAYHFSYSTNIQVVTNIVVVTNDVVITNTVITTNTVIATNILGVQFRDLFTIQTSIQRGGVTPEKVRPKFKFGFPPAKVRSTTNATFTVSGSATDNSAVQRVVYDNGQAVEIVRGTTNWIGDIPLIPGTNRFAFRSIDRFGNESKSVLRTIFYQVPTPLPLAIIGAGTVIGGTNQQKFDLGRNYTLTAKTAKGNFFAGWQGNFVTPSTRLTFGMTTNVTNVTAVFATNSFPRLRGSYVGLMTPRTTNSGPHVAGMITMNLGPAGIYNGRLQPLSRTFPIRGFFNVANGSTITGMRGSSPLRLSLTISTNGPAEIHGEYVDGAEVADVVMYRFERTTETVPQTGQFTFAIAPQESSAIGEGFGIGTVDISGDAEVTLNGSRQDSADFSQSTAIYSGAHFPLFMRWSSDEALFGWMAFGTNNDTFEGSVRWLRPVFTNLFGEAGYVNGSRFTAPAEGQPLLSWTNGSVLLSGDDLESPIEIPVSLEGGGVTAATNNITLQLTPESGGRITGSFVHPGSQAVTPIWGVFLQQSNMAAGFFPGTNRSGSIRLRSLQ
ncbi:MAG TPA: peptidylprolyl isomerase, partial [Candidatus Acidoferrum sp.]|nr:peptidylprolyl isomerase [Candidatus Acidoferrum sp.]